MSRRRVSWILLVLLLVIPMIAEGFTAEQYIADVRSGQQIACKWVQLAVDRHVNDLKRVGKPDFPYHFDVNEAKRLIQFKQLLKHTKGEWADPRKHNPQLILEPWQQFIDWVLFGWRDAAGYRRFTKAYIEVARKNGKTTDAAATANYCFLADSPREEGAEVYFAATKRDQAKIGFGEALRQIESNKVLKERTRHYKQNATVVLKNTASLMRPVGQDSDTEDGLNPHFVLIDEYHAHPDASMVNVMESGMGARRQPLIYIITTAGKNKESACYQEEHRLAEQTLERSIEPVLESYFCIIYTLDHGDDWTSPKVWQKANPNLGVSVAWKFLEGRVQEALLSPAKQNDVKTKNFNIWTQAELRWILDEKWAACNFPVLEEGLVGRPCYAGIDLSASQDITAYVLCFPPEVLGGIYEFLYRFFIPEEGLIEKERHDKVPYTYWVRQGLIYTTPGDVIDYDHVEQSILEDATKFKIREIAFDPWKAQEIVNHLTEAGFTMVPIFQRYSGMAAHTKALEDKVLARKIAHGGNPVMRWMIACTEVKSDRQDNIMPMKPRRKESSKRIDGVVASIMALGRAVIGEEGNDGYAYRDRDVLVL